MIYEANLQEMDCSICLESVKQGIGHRAAEKIYHLFHLHCLSAWLSIDQSCPSCRIKLDRSEFLRVSREASYSKMRCLRVLQKIFYKTLNLGESLQLHRHLPKVIVLALAPTLSTLSLIYPQSYFKCLDSATRSISIATGISIAGLGVNHQLQKIGKRLPWRPAIIGACVGSAILYNQGIESFRHMLFVALMVAGLETWLGLAEIYWPNPLYREAASATRWTCVASLTSMTVGNSLYGTASKVGLLVPSLLLSLFVHGVSFVICAFICKNRFYTHHREL